MEEATTLIASIDTNHYQTVLTKGPLRWMADETIADGGQGQGPTPGDLLVSALASCMAITARMYADRKGWPMTGCQVKAHMERQADGYVMTTQTSIKGDTLTADQKKRLIEIANRCPNHKLLEKTMTITELGYAGLENPAE